MKRLRLKRRPERTVVYLDLHCAGSHSQPPQACLERILMPMPFDVETLRNKVAPNGWFVTVTTPPGESPPAVTVLCGRCAEAIMPPELLAAAKRLQPGSA